MYALSSWCMWFTLCLVSTEQYGSVQFSTVRFGTGDPYQACVSTENSTGSKNEASCVVVTIVARASDDSL